MREESMTASNIDLQEKDGGVCVCVCVTIESFAPGDMTYVCVASLVARCPLMGIASPLLVI
jgi:hypothetical protein